MMCVSIDNSYSVCMNCCSYSFLCFCLLFLQVIKFPIHQQELKKEHIQQADVHFSEERARTMEMQARRMHARKSFSTLSEATSET